MLYAQERQNKILSLLDRSGRVQVAALAEAFDVSGSTIRADLRDLERAHLLARTHGGAIKVLQRSFEDVPETRNMTASKRAIAREAVALIGDGDSIVIDTGTTCTAFTEALIVSKKRDLRILTYDVKEALMLSDNTAYQVQTLGGAIRNGFHYAFGESVVQQMSGFLVDKAVLATTSVTLAKGFSTPNVSTAALKRACLDIAKESIMMCNSEKLGRDSFRIFAGIDDVDTLIIDSDAPTSVVRGLKKHRPRLIVAALPASSPAPEPA